MAGWFHYATDYGAIGLDELGSITTLERMDVDVPVGGITTYTWISRRRLPTNPDVFCVGELG